MDSREGAPPAPPPRQNMMMVPGSYSAGMGTNHHHLHHHHHNPSMMIPNYGQMMPSNSVFPFNTPPPRPQEPMNMNRPVYDGSSPSPSPSQGLRPATVSGSGGDARKKRGRPRKYVPDGNIALGLSPAPASAQTSAPSAANPGNSGNSGGTPSSENPSKRNRGRPPGSGKKQLDALGGTGGIGFTPHVIKVEEGEDIIEKINAFSMQGPRSICILSANGTICNVTLRQPTIPANAPGQTLTYEGRFHIISLSGSFLASNSDDNKRDISLRVSLSGADGQVLGGGVSGVLLAASPVQIIVGSFIEDGKKASINFAKPEPSSAPPLKMLTFGGAGEASSPPSQGGGGSSDTSGENGSSQMDRGSGLYSSSNQPIHNMNMYHQLWAGQTHQ